VNVPRELLPLGILLSLKLNPKSLRLAEPLCSAVAGCDTGTVADPGCRRMRKCTTRLRRPR